MIALTRKLSTFQSVLRPFRVLLLPWQLQGTNNLEMKTGPVHTQFKLVSSALKKSDVNPPL